ncbi:MAG: TolC family protein, partial [Cytophagales bacterium]|nr:TolC family protein [Cytophagales bacterium]
MSSLAARQAEAQVLTLEQAVQEALQNNYGIQVAMRQAERAELQVTRGNAGQLPSVDLNANYNASVNQAIAEFITGQTLDQTARASGLGASLRVNYTIFDGLGMFYRYERLEENAQLQQLNSRLQMENTVAQVISTYLEVLNQQQTAETAQEAVAMSAERLYRVERLLGAGQLTLLDKLNAQVDLVSDSTALLDAQLLLQQSKFNLQYLMGSSSALPELDRQIQITTGLDYDN